MRDTEAAGADGLHSCGSAGSDGPRSGGRREGGWAWTGGGAPISHSRNSQRWLSSSAATEVGRICQEVSVVSSGCS